MHTKRLNHTYPIPTRLSCRTPFLENPKSKNVQLPAQRSWYQRNKTLKMLELQNLITDFRVDVICRCGPQSKVLYNQMPSMHTHKHLNTACVIQKDPVHVLCVGACFLLGAATCSKFIRHVWSLVALRACVNYCNYM